MADIWVSPYNPIASLKKVKFTQKLLIKPVSQKSEVSSPAPSVGGDQKSSKLGLQWLI